MKPYRLFVKITSYVTFTILLIVNLILNKLFYYNYNFLLLLIILLLTLFKSILLKFIILIDEWENEFKD